MTSWAHLRPSFRRSPRDRGRTHTGSPISNTVSIPTRCLGEFVLPGKICTNRLIHSRRTHESGKWPYKCSYDSHQAPGTTIQTDRPTGRPVAGVRVCALRVTGRWNKPPMASAHEIGALPNSYLKPPPILRSPTRSHAPISHSPIHFGQLS